MTGCDNVTSGVTCKDEKEVNNTPFNFLSLKSYIDFDEVSANNVVKYFKTSTLNFFVNSEVDQ